MRGHGPPSACEKRKKKNADTYYLIAMSLFKLQPRVVLTRYKLPVVGGIVVHAVARQALPMHNPRGIRERRGKLAPKLSAENRELAN